MKLLIILFFAASLFLLGCKENSTDPEPEPEETGDLIEEIKIGIGGGQLDTEGFILNVPPGAFNSTADIKLYLEKDNSPLGRNAVSGLYKITGIPETINDSLEVMIKYSGTLEGTNFLMLGMDAEIFQLDTVITDIAFVPYIGNIFGDFISAKIPPTESKNSFNILKPNDGTLRFFLGLLTKGTLSASGPFEIIIEDIIHYSEVYESYLLQQYDYYYELLGEDISNGHWPMKIVINRLEDCGYFFAFCVLQIRRSHVKVNEGSSFFFDGVDDETECQSELNFAFSIATLLRIYHENNNLSWLISSIARYTSYLDEKWFDFMVPSIYTVIKQSMDGLHNQKGNPFIFEYLAGRYGDNIIKNILSDVNQGTNEFDAIFSHTANPDVWLSDFYKYLIINEKIQNRIKDRFYKVNDFWEERSSAQFRIDSQTNEVEQTNSYRGLSAKIYRINLLDGLQQGNSLSFSTEGGDTEISLFKYNQNSIEFLESSTEGVTVNNIKQLADNGYQLFALVTNRIVNYPNIDKYDITLKVKQIGSVLNACTVEIGIAGQIKYTSTLDTSFYNLYIMNDNTLPTQGQLGERDFFATWDYNEADNRYYGEIKIDFNNDLTNIVQLEYKDNWESLDGIYEHVYEVTAYNIPLLSSQASYFDYQLEGEVLCEGHLGSVRYGSTSATTSRILYDIICTGADDGTPNKIYVKIE